MITYISRVLTVNPLDLSIKFASYDFSYVKITMNLKMDVAIREKRG